MTPDQTCHAWIDHEEENLHAPLVFWGTMISSWDLPKREFCLQSITWNGKEKGRIERPFRSWWFYPIPTVKWVEYLLIRFRSATEQVRYNRLACWLIQPWQVWFSSSLALRDDQKLQRSQSTPSVHLELIPSSETEPYFRTVRAY